MRTIPTPTNTTPESITFLDPHLSTRKPIKGATKPDSRDRMANAPEVKALVHPNSLSIGKKNTLKPRPNTTVM